MIITWGDITASVLWALLTGVVLVAIIAVAYAVIARRLAIEAPQLPGASAPVGSPTGTLNLDQMIGSTIIRAIGGMKKGARGVRAAHSRAPIHGIGSEITPMLVANSPKAVPRSRSGTTFEIRLLYAGSMKAWPTPKSAHAAAKWRDVRPIRKRPHPIIAMM